MPVATTTGGETETFKLKTLDEEGYVEIRRMTYGELLQRRQMTSQMKVSSEKGQSGFSGELDLANYKVTLWEFSHVIVDHNLEDEKGNKLNFKKAADVERLNPKIGTEIGEYIDEVNQFADDEEEEELQGKSEPASSETQESQMT